MDRFNNNTCWDINELDEKNIYRIYRNITKYTQQVSCIKVAFSHLYAYYTLQRLKYTKSTRRDEVEWRDCCSLHAVTSSVIYYSTHTRKNVIYLFYTIKIQMVIEGFLGHEKRKTAVVI